MMGLGLGQNAYRFFFFGFIDIHVTSWKRWAGEDELNQGVSLVVGKFMIDRTV